jgi:hypothetical protein
MLNAFNRILSYLEESSLRVADSATRADLKSRTAQPLLKELSRSGLVPSLLILGPPLNPYANASNSADACVTANLSFQAALLIPGGIGVVAWNVDAEKPHPDALFEEARRLFWPLARCSPVLKAEMSVHVDALMERLQRCLPTLLASSTPPSSNGRPGRWPPPRR